MPISTIVFKTQSRKRPNASRWPAKWVDDAARFENQCDDATRLEKICSRIMNTDTFYVDDVEWHEIDFVTSCYITVITSRFSMAELIKRSMLEGMRVTAFYGPDNRDVNSPKRVSFEETVDYLIYIEERHDND